MQITAAKTDTSYQLKLAGPLAEFRAALDHFKESIDRRDRQYDPAARLWRVTSSAAEQLRAFLTSQLQQGTVVTWATDDRGDSREPEAVNRDRLIKRIEAAWERERQADRTTHPKLRPWNSIPESDPLGF